VPIIHGGRLEFLGLQALHRRLGRNKQNLLSDELENGGKENGHGGWNDLRIVSRRMAMPIYGSSKLMVFRSKRAIIFFLQIAERGVNHATNPRPTPHGVDVPAR
jgi:hypothetical protein